MQGQPSIIHNEEDFSITCILFFGLGMSWEIGGLFEMNVVVSYTADATYLDCSSKLSPEQK